MRETEPCTTILISANQSLPVKFLCHEIAPVTRLEKIIGSRSQDKQKQFQAYSRLKLLIDDLSSDSSRSGTQKFDTITTQERNKIKSYVEIFEKTDFENLKRNLNSEATKDLICLTQWFVKNKFIKDDSCNKTKYTIALNIGNQTWTENFRTYFQRWNAFQSRFALEDQYSILEPLQDTLPQSLTPDSKGRGRSVDQYQAAEEDGLQPKDLLSLLGTQASDTLSAISTDSRSDAKAIDLFDETRKASLSSLGAEILNSGSIQPKLSDKFIADTFNDLKYIYNDLKDDLLKKSARLSKLPKEQLGLAIFNSAEQKGLFHGIKTIPNGEVFSIFSQLNCNQSEIIVYTKALNDLNLSIEEVFAVYKIISKNYFEYLKEKNRELVQQNARLKTKYEYDTPDNSLFYLNKLKSHFFEDQDSIDYAMERYYKDIEYSYSNDRFFDLNYLDRLYGEKLLNCLRAIFDIDSILTQTTILDCDIAKSVLIKFAIKNQESQESLSEIDALKDGDIQSFIDKQVQEAKFTTEEFNNEFANEKNIQQIFSKYDDIRDAITRNLEVQSILLTRKQNIQGLSAQEQDSFKQNRHSVELLYDVDAINGRFAIGWSENKKNYIKLTRLMRAIAKYTAVSLTQKRIESLTEFYKEAIGLDSSCYDNPLEFIKAGKKRLQECDDNPIELYNKLKSIIKDLERKIKIDDKRLNISKSMDVLISKNKAEQRLHSAQKVLTEFPNEHSYFQNYLNACYYSDLINSTAVLYDYQNEHVKSLSIADALINKAMIDYSDDKTKQTEYLINCRNSLLEIMYLYKSQLIDYRNSYVDLTKKRLTSDLFSRGLAEFKESKAQISNDIDAKIAFLNKLLASAKPEYSQHAIKGAEQRQQEGQLVQISSYQETDLNNLITVPLNQYSFKDKKLCLLRYIIRQNDSGNTEEISEIEMIAAIDSRFLYEPATSPVNITNLKLKSFFKSLTEANIDQVIESLIETRHKDSFKIELFETAYEKDFINKIYSQAKQNQTEELLQELRSVRSQKNKAPKLRFFELIEQHISTYLKYNDELDLSRDQCESFKSRITNQRIANVEFNCLDEINDVLRAHKRSNYDKIPSYVLDLIDQHTPQRPTTNAFYGEFGGGRGL